MGRVGPLRFRGRAVAECRPVQVPEQIHADHRPGRDTERVESQVGFAPAAVAARRLATVLNLSLASRQGKLEA